MTIYNYRQEDLDRLLIEAKTIGNLAANLGLSKTTIIRLLKDSSVWPNKNTKNKIKMFALGYSKIEQLVRPYGVDKNV